MCRLLASEDLFALMDALEEPVPDEVHQYLETVGSGNSPTGEVRPPFVGLCLYSQNLASMASGILLQLWYCQLVTVIIVFIGKKIFYFILFYSKEVRARTCTFMHTS